MTIKSIDEITIIENSNGHFYLVGSTISREGIKGLKDIVISKNLKPEELADVWTILQKLIRQ